MTTGRSVISDVSYSSFEKADSTVTEAEAVDHKLHPSVTPSPQYHVCVMVTIHANSAIIFATEMKMGLILKPGLQNCRTYL